MLWRPIPEAVATEDANRMPGPRTVKIVKFSKSGNNRPQVKKIQVFGNQRVAQGGEVKRAKKRLRSVKKTSQQA